MSDLSLDVNFEGSGIEVDAEFGYSNTRYVSPSEYTGELTVVPDYERHILETTGKMLNGNVTVEAAPTSEVIFTENGEYLPPEGEVGFRKVEVDVPDYLSGLLDKSISGDFYLDTAFDTLFQDMFKDCNNLRSINLPNFTGTIISNTIQNMPNLEEFIAPKATTIAATAFSGSNPKCKKIDIRNVENIGGSAFRGVSKLTSPVIFLKPLTFAGSCAMSAEEIRICKEPVSIPLYAFEWQTINVWYLGFSQAKATELGFPWRSKGLRNVYYDVVFDEEGNIVSIPNP